MLSWPLLIEVVVAFVGSTVLLHRFGDWKKQNAVIIVAVLISWYFSILTVFVLPLDISSTVYRQCEQTFTGTKSVISSATENVTSESVVIGNLSAVCTKPWSYIPVEIFPRFWRIIYWSSQFLTWIVLPLMQSYTKAGEFQFCERFKYAVKDNVIYYGSFMLISVVCLGYIILHTSGPLGGQRLQTIASSSSNTWGLFLLVILLGYAFVDVPRQLWLAANPELSLQRAYFHLSKLSSEFEDAEIELKHIIQKIYAFECRVAQDDPLMCYVRKIFNLIPFRFHNTMLKCNNKRNDDLSTNQSPNLAMLVIYNKELKKALHIYRRAEIQRMLLFDKVYKLQRTVSNRKGEFQKFKDFSIFGPNKFTDRWWIFIFEYWWEAVIRPNLMKVLAVCSAVLSMLVILSEVTFFNRHPVLSIFAIIVNYAKIHYNYLLIEVLCAVVIAYMCYCAYSTVFKIRLFNYYHFAPAHQTDEYSLIFSGMLFCRLTPPLCLNFLGMIHMDSHIIQSRIMETQYTQIMGHMDVISIISNGFNIYFPMVMLVLSATTYFNVGPIVLSAVGFQQYVEDSEITEDTIVDGQRRAAAEKDRRQRKGLLAADELQQQYLSSSVQNTPPPSFNAARFRTERAAGDGSKLRDSSIYSYEMDLSNPASSLKSNTTTPSRNIFDDI